MNYESGELLCPKCNESGMNKYSNWASREVFIGEKIIKQYIFYYKTGGEKECGGFFFRAVIDCLDYLDHETCGDCGDCFRVIVFSLFFLFYIVLCFWVIDIIIYFLCPYRKKDHYHCQIRDDVKDICCSEVKDIWEEEKISNKGLTKDFWINKKNSYKDLFKCSKCFYNPDSFFPFIKKNNYDTLKVSNTETNKAIAINIISTEGQFPVVCYSDELFKDILKKFFKDFPKYNINNCYFLGHSEILKPNLTISKNYIKNGDNIQCHLLNDEESNDNYHDEDYNDYRAYSDASD